MPKKFPFLRTLTSLLVLICAIGITHAQQSFHRLYNSDGDRNVVLLSGTQTKSGNYATLCVEEFEDINSKIKTDTLIITTFEPKGDVKFSKRIALKDDFLNIAYNKSSIVEGDNDSLYFALFSTNNGLTSRTMGSLSAGVNLDTLSFQNAVMGSYGNDYYDGENILRNYNGALFQVFNSDSVTYLQKRAYDQSVLWSHELKGNTIVNWGAVTSLHISSDTTLLMTGFDQFSFFVETDTLGNLLTSKYYPVFGAIVKPVAAFKYQDTIFNIVGNHENGISFFATDTSSAPITAKKFSIGNDTLHVIDAVRDLNGDYVLFGYWTSATTKKTHHFAVKLNPNGTVEYKKYFDRVEVPAEDLGSISATADGGVMIFCTQIDGTSLVPALIKLNPDGSSLCEQELPDFTVSNIDIFEEDMKMESRETQQDLQRFPQHQGPFNFNIPVLSLKVDRFCPNEQIDWLFDASVKGLEKEPAYLWDSGETTDTLRVHDTEKHSVMVTIDEKVCYILCDTAKLERYNTPSVIISSSYEGYCADNKIQLTSFITSGKPPVKSIKWSTGETSETIRVTPGTYSVTIVDSCDEVATTSATAVKPIPLSTVTIEKDGYIVDCIKGEASGTLTAIHGYTDLTPVSFSWSTGEKTESISPVVTMTSTYTVTATDLCGNSAISSIEIKFEGKGIQKVEIIPDNSNPCSDTIRLNAVTDVNGENFKYKWSNGSTDAYTDVSISNTYSVTVTDLCGNTATNAITINFNSFEASIYADFKTLCSDETVRLNALANQDGNYSYLWSNGSTNAYINVSDPGKYSVTIKDPCNNTASADFELAESQFVQYLRYAHVFFPGGVGLSGGTNDTLTIRNRTFGPIRDSIICLEKITDYQFLVFNRWGQEVFSTTNINEEWNGTHNNEPAPPDTYIYAVRYKYNRFSASVKGDVTLIR